MSPLVHRIYVTSLVSIVVLTTLFLLYKGIPYYGTSLEERFYHPSHENLKSSGVFGHGLGIAGVLLVLIGVLGYIARKRFRSLARIGRLKYWLEFHIFLCTLGPIMILFHTTFKFGGIAAVSFWSMVAVVVSGIIGRFIYIQIPRTIEGRALSLNEVKEMRTNVSEILESSYLLDKASNASIVESALVVTDPAKEGNILARMVRHYFEDRAAIRQARATLRKNKLPAADIRKVIRLIKSERSLNNRIERLQVMQDLFKYWHVAHLPFAIIMLIFLVFHVGVALAFGYRWIF